MNIKIEEGGQHLGEPTKEWENEETSGSPSKATGRQKGAKNQEDMQALEI